MLLMSTSMVFCQNLFSFKKSRSSQNSFSCHNSSSSVVLLSSGRRKSCRQIPNAKKRHSKRLSWWQRFFLEDDENWLGLKDEDMLDGVESEEGSSGDVFSENEKFEEWKRRAEAIIELREAEENAKNEENRRWEDWLVNKTNGASWVQESNGAVGEPLDDVGEDFSELISGRGLIKSVRDLVQGREDDDILYQYEEGVFRYASFNSAKFLAILVIVPWAMDFLVHDYVLMPFLDRLKLQDEWRLENRKAFANIWSDMVFGVSLFIILYFNQSKVALLKFTGYRILSNISDTGKAFLIILVTDIFLGYHSESGWQTLLEVLVEHYGLEVNQAAITIFISLVPVIIDACVKLWLFKFLPGLSPRVAKIFQETKRH